MLTPPLCLHLHWSLNFLVILCCLPETGGGGAAQHNFTSQTYQTFESHRVSKIATRLNSICVTGVVSQTIFSDFLHLDFFFLTFQPFISLPLCPLLVFSHPCLL